MFRLEHGDISIHAAREGGDDVISDKIAEANISIHAAREGGDRRQRSIRTLHHISIHAAREGGDFVYRGLRKARTISIHAAREGGDVQAQHIRLCGHGFQSTPPVKAATYIVHRSSYANAFQSLSLIHI